MTNNSLKYPVLLIIALFLGGCSLFGGDDDGDEFAGLSTEEQFYRRALGQLNSQNFNGAIATYQAPDWNSLIASNTTYDGMGRPTLVTQPDGAK